MLKLNETPVRTANNFRINNIEIDSQIPENISEFKNIKISKQYSLINESVSKSPLIYGVSKDIEQKANSKIKIENNEKTDNVKITYTFDDNNLVLFNQIDIVANKDINIVIEYNSNTNKRCFHSGIIKTFARNKSKVNVTIINFLNDLSDNLENVENTIEDESKVYHTIIDIGAKNSISNYYSNVAGKQAVNNLKTIYLGQGSQLKDLNYIVELTGKQSNVDIDVQGALKDKSIKHFKGTIDFKQGCSKSKGNENEYCMLLSDEAESTSLPMLL